MTKEELGKLSVAALKERAKELGVKGTSAMRKMDLVNALFQAAQEDHKDASGEEKPRNTKKKAAEEGSSGSKDPEKKTQTRENGQGSFRQNSRRLIQPRQDGHARVIVRKSPGTAPGSGNTSSAPAKSRGNGTSPQAPQNRSAGSSASAAAPGRSVAGSPQAPQNRSAGSSAPAAAPGRSVAGSPQAPQNRSAGSSAPAAASGRGMAGSPQVSQSRSAGIPADGQPKTYRPSGPMTRGEMYQSNPQPRNENAETIQDRMEQDRPPMELKQLDSGNEVSGVLEVMADGYGFIRSNNYLPGDDDVYVSPSQIRKFGLKTGDIICGNTRVHAQQEKFSALLFVKLINGYTPSEAARRYDFDSMTPVFPNERLRMERTGREIAMRIVDLLAPIGKGQRGLIVSPPKAGKTTLLKDIARSIQRNNPEMHIIIMLIDERPEEVTDIREAIVGDNVEVLDSTFDETPEHHKRVAEMGIERARRLVEHKRDVVILLDSITRLARAYNLIVPPSGRTLSGGLDPAALHPPKHFFGAARNMREGGSLTILATALVDTGSKMDDVVYEEFKGTGNMELILDRKLSERRVFPAIDIQKSGTRREDLLLTTDEGEAAYVMRRAMNGMKGEDAVERILDMFARTRSNEELIQRVKHSHVV